MNVIIFILKSASSVRKAVLRSFEYSIDISTWQRALLILIAPQSGECFL